MGCQRHIAIPGKERAIGASHRNAVEPQIGDRDRLHGQGALPGIIGDAEQRALERQDAVAVARGALGEEDEVVAGVEPLANGVALRGGAAHAAVDEDGALQPGQPAEQRPARHLGLGDEAALDDAAEDLDVDIGDMVGDEQRRPQRRRFAVHGDAEAHDPATPAVVEARQAARPCTAAGDKQCLHRHERQGERHIAGEPDQPEQHRAHGLTPPWNRARGARSADNTYR